MNEPITCYFCGEPILSRRDLVVARNHGDLRPYHFRCHADEASPKLFKFQFFYVHPVNGPWTHQYVKILPFFIAFFIIVELYMIFSLGSLAGAVIAIFLLLFVLPLSAGLIYFYFWIKGLIKESYERFESKLPE